VIGRQRGWCQALAEAEPDPLFRRKLSAPCLFPLPILQSTDFRGRWPNAMAEAGDGGEVSRIVVAPRYRGAGVSRVLVRAAIAVAFDLRKRSLMLECAPAHVAMYEKYGFTPLGGHHVRTTQLDQRAVAMTLPLDDRLDNPVIGQAR